MTDPIHFPTAEEQFGEAVFETPEQAFVSRRRSPVALPSFEQTLADRARARAEGRTEGPATSNGGFVAELDAIKAETAAIQAQQEALEARHGKFGTAVLQGARGVLDFVTWPGALLGAGLEGTGALVGSQTLRDFGRDLGESSSGKAAIEALSPETLAHVFTGEKQQALSVMERNRLQIEEQEKAWPTLSTISRPAGTIGAAVVTGGLAAAPHAAGGGAAAAHGVTRAGVAVAAIEGAGTGAQAAYEQQAPLRDVFASTLLGAGLGGGVAAAPALLKSIKIRQRLADFADERTMKALGARGSDLKALARDANVAERKLHEYSQTIRSLKLDDGTQVFKALADPGEHAATLKRAKDEIGKKLEALRGSADDIIKANPEMAPNVDSIASRIRKEVLEPIESGKLEGTRLQGRRIRRLIGEVEDLGERRVTKRAVADGKSLVDVERSGKTTLQDLYQLRRELDGEIYGLKDKAILKQQGAHPRLKNLEKARRVIEEAIEDSTEKAAKHMDDPLVYQRLKRDYEAVRVTEQIAGSAALKDLGNRVVSPTDYLVGAATFAGDLGSGGAVSALKALAASSIHKAIREKSSGIFAVGAAKLAGQGTTRHVGRIAKTLHRLEHGVGPGIHELEQALMAPDATIGQDIVEGLSSAGGMMGRTSGPLMGRVQAAGELVFGQREQIPEVPIELAGGREAQQILTELERVKAQIRRSEDAAGPNPDLRQQARQQATDGAVFTLIERAGEYDLDNWFTRPPTPLQKAVYRSQILDRVSEDVAGAVNQIPEADELQLDPEMLGRFTDDAAGPEAIGTLQQGIEAALEQAPVNAEGDGLGFQLRLVRQQLGRAADVPGAMVIGHDTVNRLRELAATTTDDVTASFAARQAQAIQELLGSEHFGSAGELYRRAVAPNSEQMQQLADPVAARELLRRADTRGAVTRTLSEQRDLALAAAQAAEQLTGRRGLRKATEQAYKRAGDVLLAAEDAVTVDGGPIGRVADFFRDSLDGRMAGTLGQNLEDMVFTAVRPKLSRLLPVLQGKLERSSIAPRAVVLTRTEQIAAYEDRLSMLEELLSDPEMGSLLEGLKAFPGVNEQLSADVGSQMTERLAKLHNDLPKPRQSLSGPSPLSEGELSKASALWEATMDPMSILDDLETGLVDYDKVQYAGEQWPGLQLALQAGAIDMLTSQLDDAERGGIPDGVLTQLDYVLGFGGRLQTSVDRAFAARITAAGQQMLQERARAAPRQLQLPGARPTMTQRISTRSPR